MEITSYNQREKELRDTNRPFKISIAKETWPGEKRVLLLPKEVKSLVDAGNEVIVEKNSGLELGVYDRAYENVGAKIVTDRSEIFGKVDLVAKLKAPTNEEFNLLNNNLLFAMIHHAQNPHYVDGLGERGAKAIEIESVFNDFGERLIDETFITGEMGVLYASQHTKKIPQHCNALVLGYGRVGSGAISMCNKLGINTKILRKEEYRNIDHFLEGKDLLINAISWPEEERKNKNYIVTGEKLSLMNNNGVVLDLSVDFPNPIETCRPTSLNNPYYIERGKIHIGIYGYPGLVPISSSEIYGAQSLPLLLEISENRGLEGLSKKSDLGRYISSAIVDPEKIGWNKIKSPNNKSFIE